MKAFNKTKLFLTSVIFFGLLLSNAVAQISAPTATSSFSTDYSVNYINGGGENDMVFVFCGNQDENAVGELQVDGSGCTVAWYMFDGVSYQPMGIAGSVISGLQSGGYMAQVDCGGGDVNCYRAWVWVNQTFVDVGEIEPGCVEFTLQGSANVLDNEFTIQDPPGTNFEVSEATEITVCFWADHSWVSDLGFYLKAPGHELDEPEFPVNDDGNHEVVELLPSVSDWGPGASQGSWTGIPFSTLGCGDITDENTPCQGGDGLEAFCFTNTLDAGNPTFTPCVCDLPTPLNGMFASVGPWDAIYGNMAGDEGWNVQIYDCENNDFGSLNRALISFTQETLCGTTTFVYDSGDISSEPGSAIADNSCSASTASSYIVPAMDPPGAYTVTSSITSTVWSCTGSSFTSTDLTPTVVPGTSDFPGETSDFSLTVTETINVPSAPTCVHTESQTFITTPSDATITPIAPRCYNSAPVEVEVAHPGGDLTISASAGPDALLNGIFDPEAAGSGTHTIFYDITGACPDSDQINVTVYEHIVVENVDHMNCDGSNENYELTFDVNNEEGVGTQFQVNDGSGFQTYNNSYSTWLPSPSGYSLTVTDMNGCDSYVVEGFRDCGCGSFAGSMQSLEVVNLCQGETTGSEVSHFNNQILDGDDVFEFILHTGEVYPADGTSIIARGPDTDFSFLNGVMDYEVIYYISAICGDNDGLGNVDYTDNCYSQAPGTPVIWHQNPIVSITETSLSVCGLTINLEGNEPSAGMNGFWTADGGFVPAGGTGINDHQITVLADNFGDYTFTWNISNGECTGSDDIDVSFYDTPSAFAGNDTTVCGNQIELNAILSTGGSDGVWSANGVSFNPATSENALATLNAGEYGTYVLTWTESIGSCSDEDFVSVTFVEQPQPTVINNVDTVCGVNGVIHAQNVNFDGVWTAYETDGTQVFPSFTDGPDSPLTGVSISNYPGNYRTLDFIWTETNTEYGVVCTNSVTQRLVFAKVPNAFVGDDYYEDVCGNVYTFDADTTGSGWAEMYWQGKETVDLSFDDNSLPDATVTINPLSAYGDSAHVEIPFQWVVRSGGGCFDIDTMWVTFYKEPVANAGLDDSICGLQYDLEAFYSLPDTTNYSAYGIWSNPAGNPGTVNFLNTEDNGTQVNVGTPGTYRFVWRENNSMLPGCHSTDTVEITFKENPVIDAGDDFDVCGNTTTLSATTSGFDLTWQPVGGAVFEDYNAATTGVTFGGYGEVTFSIIESNEECVDTDEVTVHFWRRPSATHLVDEADTTVCGRVFPRLRAENPGGGVVGNWISVPANGVTFYNQYHIDTVSVLNYDHYTFWWTESTGPDDEGPDFCSDTSEPFTVHFIEIPDANAGTDTVFCGYSGNLNAEVSVNNGNSSGTWFNVSSNITFEEPGNPETLVTSDVLTTNNPSYDNFELVWTEDNYGCTNSDTVVVGFARIPEAIMTIIPPRCEGEPASIRANEDSLANYNWQWNGGLIDSIWPENDQGGKYRHLVYWPNDDTSHIVSLSVENYWGCVSPIIDTIIFEPYRPTYKVVTYPDTCALGKGAFEFLPDTTTEYPSFSWFDVNGEEQPVPVGDTIFNIPAGTYEGTHQYLTFNNTWSTQYINLYGTDQCVDAIEFDIDTAGVVKAEFVVSAATDMNALVAPNAEVIFDNLSDGDDVRTSCTWYFGDGESENTCDEQVIHVYTEPNECYEPYLVVRVRDLPECRDTAFMECITIDDMSELEIPNIFTPNGDNMNDFFQVRAQTLQTFRGIIVNRWGRTIYEWTDYETMEAGWDGKLSGGSNASPGVYYYIIKATGMDGVEYDESGPFHLVREKQ